jgi:DNA-binding NarL/FixJ family response regulator
MSKTRVLIVDSQPIFRAGVRRALAHHCGLEKLEILDCDPGNDGEGAIRQIDEDSPHVALVSIGGPSPDGLQLSSRIARDLPATKVIVLSANHNADELFEVIKTGAAAYLSRDSEAEELSDAIMRAASGQYPINDNLASRPKVASLVLDQFEDMASVCGSGDAKDTIVSPLTPRETQFLNLIAEDNPNRQIAAILGMEEHEIKKCVGAILCKLNASDRAHAVMLSLCDSWLSLQDAQTSSQAQDLVAVEPAAAKEQRPTKRKTNSPAKAKRRNSTKTGQPATVTHESQTTA